MPELYRSEGPDKAGRGSNPRGLRVRFGECSGDEGLARGRGEGESERCPIVFTTMGKECARVIGGALHEAELLCERM